MNVHNELMKLNFAPSNFETLTNMNFYAKAKQLKEVISVTSGNKTNNKKAKQSYC